jgi:hypothetical protein
VRFRPLMNLIILSAVVFCFWVALLAVVGGIRVLLLHLNVKLLLVAAMSLLISLLFLPILTTLFSILQIECVDSPTHKRL